MATVSIRALHNRFPIQHRSVLAPSSGHSLIARTVRGARSQGCPQYLQFREVLLLPRHHVSIQRSRSLRAFFSASSFRLHDQFNASHEPPAAPEEDQGHDTRASSARTDDDTRLAPKQPDARSDQHKCKAPRRTSLLGRYIARWKERKLSRAPSSNAMNLSKSNKTLNTLLARAAAARWQHTNGALRTWSAVLIVSALLLLVMLSTALAVAIWKGVNAWNAVLERYEKAKAKAL
ncbi:MAG: hypothetical protein LQ346_005791, partial [Caloplaca aetnensis]